MFKSIVAVALGAAIGAISRWLLGNALNPLFSTFSAGILFANLLGGFLIGILLHIISIYPEISTTWKLFLMTGLLGSLTTFSAFSAEIFTLLQSQRWGNALLVALIHLLGSILMTALGFITATYMRKLILSILKII